MKAGSQLKLIHAAAFLMRLVAMIMVFHITNLATGAHLVWTQTSALAITYTCLRPPPYGDELEFTWGVVWRALLCLVLLSVFIIAR